MVQYYSDFTSGSNPNLLINGGFDIWQRGTSFTAGGYLCDRWFRAGSGITATTSRQTFTVGQTDVPDNPVFYMRHDLTAGGTLTTHYSYIQQRIEDVRTLAGKNATVSFWAKADSSKSIAVGLAQMFGSSGSDTVVLDPQEAALTSSWQKFELTWAVPSISGKSVGGGDSSLRLTFYHSAGSALADVNAITGLQTGTFDIANVKVEESSVATAFVKRQPAEELALCQRYYYHIPNANSVGVGSAINASQVRCAVNYPVTMRATPTCTATGNQIVRVQVNASVTMTFNISYLNYPEGCTLVFDTPSGFTPAARDALILDLNGSATGEFQFDAEL